MFRLGIAGGRKATKFLFPFRMPNLNTFSGGLVATSLVFSDAFLYQTEIPLPALVSSVFDGAALFGRPKRARLSPRRPGR